MQPPAASPYSLDKGLALRRATPGRIAAEEQRLLANHLKQLEKVPYYRQLFRELSLTAETYKEPGLLGSLPFTTRADIDNHQQLFGLQDRTVIRDIALTSGTTGQPVEVGYTANDLQRLAYNEAVAFYSAGVRRGDRVLLTVTLDRCFIAGLAYYAGVTALGATAVRSGPGQPVRQWQIIERLQPSVIVGVPSFLLELALWAKNNDKEVTNSPIQTIVTIGEPARTADYQLTPVGLQLEELWGASIYSSYGATEFETAFGECSAQAGGHVHPELMVVEIVDDEGNPLPEGQPGEVVVTPLGVEGFPLLRLRTGDISRLDRNPCACGWNTPRLGPIEGRLAQRLKYRGTTFYPETIFQALQRFTEIAGVYVEVRSTSEGQDEVTVVVGCDGGPGGIRERLEEHLQSHLRVRPKLVVKACAEVLAKMAGDGGRKLKRFFDLRDTRKQQPYEI